MEITEVRIKLTDDGGDRLQAFCSITFDNAFVVRDLKIIQGSSGPFVAMPSRKLTSRCAKCGTKNHLRAAHCNGCGVRLKQEAAARDSDGREKLYADIAHPINSACREMIQERVITEFEAEVDRSAQPGYVSRYDDPFDDYDDGYDEPAAARKSAAESRASRSDADAPKKSKRRKSGSTRAEAAQSPGGPHTSRSKESSGSSQSEDFGAGIFD